MQAPFAQALKKLLKCKDCGTKQADPLSGLCRECEIKKLNAEQHKEDT